MKLLMALFAGTIFGLGLSISGMTNPAKVLDFLDVGGEWDPTLAFVMGAALLVTATFVGLILKWRKPWLADRFQLPALTSIDSRLVAGATLFGIGWGLGGFCPGPAIAGLINLAPGVMTFVLAMIAGMAVYEWLLPKKT